MKSTMSKIEFIKAEDTYSIRQKVLRENIPLPVEFKGDFDQHTFHIGVFEKGELVAISSFMKSDNELFSDSQYQLRGMATLESSRGIGAGRSMMQKALEILKARKVKYLWCNARVVALDFYKKMGMETVGKAFNLQYIGDHYVMFKKLD